MANLNDEESLQFNNDADISNEWVREFQSLSNEEVLNLKEEKHTNNFWTDLQDEWNTTAS